LIQQLLHSRAQHQQQQQQHQHQHQQQQQHHQVGVRHYVTSGALKQL
jgi:hypothetical protein